MISNDYSITSSRDIGRFKLVLSASDGDTSNNESYHLYEGFNYVGRTGTDRAVDIPIDDLSVSDIHAEIYLSDISVKQSAIVHSASVPSVKSQVSKGHQVTIKDLLSKNGTYVVLDDGDSPTRKLMKGEVIPLRHMSRVRFGSVIATVVCDETIDRLDQSLAKLDDDLKDNIDITSSSNLCQQSAVNESGGASDKARYTESISVHNGRYPRISMSYNLDEMTQPLSHILMHMNDYDTVSSRNLMTEPVKEVKSNAATDVGKILQETDKPVPDDDDITVEGNILNTISNLEKVVSPCPEDVSSDITEVDESHYHTCVDGANDRPSYQILTELNKSFKRMSSDKLTAQDGRDNDDSDSVMSKVLARPVDSMVHVDDSCSHTMQDDSISIERLNHTDVSEINLRVADTVAVAASKAIDIETQVIIDESPRKESKQANEIIYGHDIDEVPAISYLIDTANPCITDNYHTKDVMDVVNAPAISEDRKISSDTKIDNIYRNDNENSVCHVGEGGQRRKQTKHGNKNLQNDPDKEETAAIVDHQSDLPIRKTTNTRKRKASESTETLSMNTGDTKDHLMAKQVSLDESIPDQWSLSVRSNSTNRDQDPPKAATASISKPCTPSRSETDKIRILHTGLDPDKYDLSSIPALCKKIRAIVVDDPHEATHVIVGEELKRTPKLMIAINIGVPYILRFKWLQDSVKQKKAILSSQSPFHSYVAQDEAKERQWGCKILDILPKQRSGDLFQGLGFYMLNGVCGDKAPPEEDMMKIIQSGGGYTFIMGYSKTASQDSKKLQIVDRSQDEIIAGHPSMNASQPSDKATLDIASNLIIEKEDKSDALGYESSYKDKMIVIANDKTKDQLNESLMQLASSGPGKGKIYYPEVIFQAIMRQELDWNSSIIDIDTSGPSNPSKRIRKDTANARPLKKRSVSDSIKQFNEKSLQYLHHPMSVDLL